MLLSMKPLGTNVFGLDTSPTSVIILPLTENNIG